ncbi:unnamed protein product [Bursaphelenchus xylophilus]|uniref:(pine wood nematode) hypothetical protein n=1 Tax=Bursaphelenchus xylophilus TaxID=6326 RepID=A0A1I7RT78_BURXY|nr:unnamed protein product [Bursaphelenchus xylophilus]CAG9122554.1 unnamed protein product [Bursaphelenchus xylophilus]
MKSKFLFLLLLFHPQIIAGDFGSASVDDTIYATKHDDQIALEEFFDNNHLYLARPDISTQLFIELNVQGTHEKNVTNKIFYKTAAKNLRKANPMVNIIKLSGGYNVCFKDGTLKRSAKSTRSFEKPCIT